MAKRWRTAKEDETCVSIIILDKSITVLCTFIYRRSMEIIIWTPNREESEMKTHTFCVANTSGDRSRTGSQLTAGGGGAYS